MRSAYPLPFLAVALAIQLNLSAEVEPRLDPPYWWAEMPTQELQLMIAAPKVGQSRASIDYPGVAISRQIAVDSPNYLCLYLDIQPEAPAGVLEIVLINSERTETIPYELKTRRLPGERRRGFDASDTIYLLMPDRFANGDPENDSIPGMLESANREDPTKRQGGDIAGIAERLDYLQDLGMTAIWLTPTFENDMPASYGAYHGYAATDFYRIDRRLGSNDSYRQLIASAHQRGMKVIMDMIHNHIGIEHPWMDDLPTADWVHDLETYGLTNFRGTIPTDPYASKADRDRLLKAWFVPEMPDLNQRNPLLADYLIQNTLWWIEDSGIDGIRMDTYIYPYPEYMARWAKEVRAAYPDISLIGEAWVETVPQVAFWQYDPPGVDDGYNSHLPSITDFNFAFAARKAFIEEFGWETGLMRLYYMLSQDFLYADANLNVTFLDNHDMPRLFEQVGQDETAFRMALIFLMTTRGVPQIYYGTEFMMGHEDRGGDDELWRQNMPGGWPNDERSLFTVSDRSLKEQSAFEFLQKLAQWRRSATAVHEGSLLQFVPENNSYVYFRIHEAQVVMIAFNGAEEPMDLDLSRFAEVLNGFEFALDVMSDERIDLTRPLPMPSRNGRILELLQD